MKKKKKTNLESLSKEEIQQSLVEKLIRIGAIHKSTILEVSFDSFDMGVKRIRVTDRFLFQKAAKTGSGKLVIYLDRLHDTTSIKINDYKSIKTVDDMDLHSLAEAYELKADGSPKPVKVDPVTGLVVKRGRPKTKVKANG